MLVPTPEQIHSYATIHERIAVAIAELTPNQLQMRPADNEWSIQQVLLHLPDSEAVGYERIRRIIAEERPVLQLYDEDAWACNLHYHQQDPHLALELFKLLRQSSAVLLQQLPAADWKRVGLHAVNGAMNLYTIFQTYLHHGEAHLRQIEDVKRRLRGDR
ncbi:hypothetical protein KSF_095310 [Reticulibacter mediterranei]|uniref:DinB-like domain-containing protein n=1 Tax=Reticulibacter mediterranei TaxID=2778369 RepID=A0A8J3IS92_9CHLR|nr:DinB family protein [Reticulibacter mediterranei]GHO99483.1 hypothetical protein KSF_095310 [Reticulibacter mediterranei]